MKTSKNEHNYYNNNLKIFNQFKKNYLDNNLKHSIILYGEKGIGKFTFIKYFICQLFNNFSLKVDLNYSNHTTLIQNNSHPNVMIISRLTDEKNNKLKNSITIDQIRSIENYIYQSSLFDLPKIIIIDSLDDLNINAANSLLKILEEPKKNTFFFLVSHQPSKLLPTIKSRCIKFKFNKPNYTEFEKIILLNNLNSINEKEIKYLFHLTNGSPGVALQYLLLDTSDIYVKTINIFKQNRSLNKNIIEFSSELSNFDNDQFFIFLLIIKFIILNILKINLGIDIKNNISIDLSNELYEISENLNHLTCMKTFDYLSEYENKLFTFNLDKKIFVINLFSKILFRQ